MTNQIYLFKDVTIHLNKMRDSFDSFTWVDSFTFRFNNQLEPVFYNVYGCDDPEICELISFCKNGDVNVIYSVDPEFDYKTALDSISIDKKCIVISPGPIIHPKIDFLVTSKRPFPI